MEPNEIQELHEHSEHAAHDSSLRGATFTMALLAVLVALVTVLGHRSHTEAILSQARASDEWNLYQAKKIRVNDTALASDLLAALTLRDPAAAAKIQQSYKDHQAKWADDLKEGEDKAREFEAEVTHAEHRADRFDLGEALLEIGLVVTSITLLTRQRGYWYLGLGFGLAGIIAAALGVVAV
jgi:hypothetical protein